MAKRSQTPSGPSQRQLRVAELIRRALSDVLLHGELHDPDLEGVSVTVGEVRCSPDLQHATVFVLPLGGKDADVVLKALERGKSHLRRVITKDLKLRHSPDLRFRKDNSFDQMDETRRLLNMDEVRRDLDRD